MLTLWLKFLDVQWVSMFILTELPTNQVISVVKALVQEATTAVSGCRCVATRPQVHSKSEIPCECVCVCVWRRRRCWTRAAVDRGPVVPAADFWHMQRPLQRSIDVCAWCLVAAWQQQARFEYGIFYVVFVVFVVFYFTCLVFLLLLLFIYQVIPPSLTATRRQRRSCKLASQSVGFGPGPNQLWQKAITQIVPTIKTVQVMFS